MSWPKKRIGPSTRAAGTRSCMRFSARKNVDFPQPLGPMIAVMERAGTSIATFLSTCVSPKKIFKLLTSKAGLTALAFKGEFLGSLCFTGGISAAIIGKLLSKAFSGQSSRRDVDAGHKEQQHQRPRPSLAMPVVVWRDSISENLQRQRGDWFGGAGRPKPIADRRGKQRG